MEDGWVGGWNGKCKSRFKDWLKNLQKNLVPGWVEVKAVLRIAYSNIRWSQNLLTVKPMQRNTNCVMGLSHDLTTGSYFDRIDF